MDSPSISQEAMSKWATSLTSGYEQSQIESLRQISNEDSVIGLAKEVVRLAGSSSDEVRVWAAEALETTVQPEGSDLPHLVELIEQSPDGEVCYWATTMLGRLGDRASSTATTLEHCLVHSTYLAARERAVWALSQIGQQAITALPSLQQVAGEVQHPRLARLAGKVANRLTANQESPEKRKRA